MGGEVPCISLIPAQVRRLVSAESASVPFFISEEHCHVTSKEGKTECPASCAS